MFKAPWACPLFTVWSDSTLSGVPGPLHSGAASPWHLISLCCSIQLPPCVWSRYFPITSELSSRADSRGTPHLIDSVNALPGAVSLYDQRASGLCACCFFVLEGCPLPATCENQTLLQMSLLPGSPWGSPLLERVAHVNGLLKK